MLKNKIDNSNITKHLGQTSQYKSSYDKSLLVREPRSNNREYLKIYSDALPFVGYDTWNAYECSFLLNNGRPVAGVVKLVYPCDSKYIVESKSIKLYFNSFNMTKIGNTVNEGIKQFEEITSKDLSDLLETNVRLVFKEGHIANEMCPNDEWSIDDYVNVDLINSNDIIFNQYTEDETLLTSNIKETADDKWFYSGLLKSNCRVTSQPDWGDIFIYIKTKHDICPLSVLKYIVSFRDECHFHEEICECVYKRFHDKFEPEELLVMCLYARRGGIDINPIRASSNELLDWHPYKGLIDPNRSHVKTSKQ
jgi:7-cyano-7-deazaguanine reductase